MVKLGDGIRLWLTPRAWACVRLDTPMTVDGVTYSDHVMRRREGGRIVYRQATDEEIRAEIWFWAIK